MDRCLPILHLIDTTWSVPYAVKQIEELHGIPCAFDQAMQNPRKCFERASEKSNTDSLSSVAASCSWGKPVAVGTGLKLDLLWDKTEVEQKHEGEIDVYGFLHMVRDKGFVNGFGHRLSPCREKPSFEDSELVNGTLNDGWTCLGWGKKCEGTEDSKSQNPWAPKEWRKNPDRTN
ncbi:hypothetical protein SAY86_031122 [Trapa natans]|uniref:DNA-directed RNA polymerase n=1 Tax=Trapa natans TaxID=22666 RepID=A0AAN7RHQ8_TRANT|nr:hypothetical protein SAY86_031122 [Trapa natans]